MALTPMLVIGCGGSGGKVVLGLRRRLEEELSRRGWDGGLPRAWQLKWIDVPGNQESHPEFGSGLPDGDYVGLSNGVSQYSLIDGALSASAAGRQFGRLVGWRPDPTIALPVHKGAGQMRGVGRAVALANSQAVSGLVRSSLAEIAGGVSELGQLSKHLGGDGQAESLPAVFVVSSMAGGTGAGIFMDVCDVVRGVNPELNPNIFGVLFTAEIFASVGADSGMAPNTAAAMGELMSGFLAADRPVEPLYGLGGDQRGQSGPTIPLVVGMQPLGGGEPLQSASQCYRAVTETLVAAMANERFQQSFVGYQITNFAPNSGATDRQTAYRMLNTPRVEGSSVVSCGMVSSFGSAVVSVGSGRFGEWSRDRLSRSVLDHLVSGWRELGRQLMGDRLSPSTTDADVIEFLVSRDRNAFIDQCGLWEEDEPDGHEHNQVLDGILSIDELTGVRDRFRSKLLSELGALGDSGAGAWQSNIEGLVATKRAGFLGDVEKELVEGVEEFCSKVVDRVADAVSDWLARFGVPVTQGLVHGLEQQCRTAISQLKADAVAYEQKAAQSPGQYVLASFQSLGSGKCRADSEFVKSGLSQALGPLQAAASQRRCEVAASVLERVVQRLVAPLQRELADVGEQLADEELVKEIAGWPDDGGDVSAVYRPAPSEFVLMDPSTWDAEYQRLLGLSAGSVTQARDLVAAGGFEYGPVLARETAPAMVSFAGDRWWDPNAGHVEVSMRLRPGQVVDRARQWMWDDNHALGKFMRVGLGEFLSETGSERHGRLKRFETALSGALSLAKPLVRIDPSLMQRVHPGKDELSVELVCEPFPFVPSNVEAREIVERVMAPATAPHEGWFETGNTAGVESILITSILTNAVQPAVISSLTSPIASGWADTKKHPNRRYAIAGFQTYNRARLLAESVPLTAPALERVVAGWFLGRVLGCVTAATESEPFTVKYVENGGVRSAALPWPVLRHGRIEDLHSRSYQAEWLPALLEQLPIAMMMIGHDGTSLDGYERLFRLGERSTSVLETWINEGVTPTGDLDGCQLQGDTAEERKDFAMKVFDAMAASFAKRRSEAVLTAEWSDFVKIPYGYSLLPTFVSALQQLTQSASRIDHSGEFG